MQLISGIRAEKTLQIAIWHDWNLSGINRNIKAQPIYICLTKVAMVKLFLHIYHPHLPFLDERGWRNNMHSNSLSY